MKTIVATTEGPVGDDLARAIVAQVTDHPETHNQKHVINHHVRQCCLTGWGVLIHFGVELGPDSWKEINAKLEATGERRAASSHVAEWLGVDYPDYLRQIFSIPENAEALANLKRLTGIEE